MSLFVLSAHAGRMRVCVCGGDISCQTTVWMGSPHDATEASLLCPLGSNVSDCIKRIFSNRNVGT